MKTKRLGKKNLYGIIIYMLHNMKRKVAKEWTQSSCDYTNNVNFRSET